MANQLRVIAEVEGLGKVVETLADFYTELGQLNDGGARLISPRNEAYARLQTRGKEGIGKFYGTWTTGGFEYAKEQLPIFRVKSRLTSRLAELAVEANRGGNYFHTGSTKEYEASLVQAEKDKNKEPEKRNVIILPSREKFTMSDKENWEVYQAILKDQSKSYFEFNGPITVYPMGKKIVDSQDGTILTALGFANLGSESSFFGNGRDLDIGSRARGVCVSAKGTVQKNSGLNIHTYTPAQARKYLRILNGVMSGKYGTSKLAELADFLKR